MLGRERQAVRSKQFTETGSGGVLGAAPLTKPIRLTQTARSPAHMI